MSYTKALRKPLTNLYSRFTPQLPEGPRHVAFIMDGNRRWAREMGYASVTIGHEYGAARAEKILKWCHEANIQHTTVFVASLDNLLKRPAEEIQCITGLIERFVKRRVAERDCRIHVAGRLDYLPPRIARVLEDACEESSHFPTDKHVTTAIAYDGHTEIVDAVRSWLRQKAKTGATLEQLARTITVEDIAENLYTNGQPYPDMVVRTGGDLRLSCFMPWQTAHSYLYFSPAYWPALSKTEFTRALRTYAAARREGGSPMLDLRTQLFDMTRTARQYWTIRKNGLKAPKHVAVMLSGNDLRTKADPDRVRHGVEDGIVNIEELLSWCKELQIETVTLGLLAADQLAQANGDLSHRLNDLVRVVEDLSNSPTKPKLRVHGRLDMLPDPILSQVNEAVARTANNTGLRANLVICYDGRSEIVHAVRELLAEHARQGRSIDDIPDGLEINDINNMLCAPGEPDLDLIIRLSSDRSLNGFLLWQAVRSEFWFCKGNVARFERANFMNALRDYGSRNRRFGA